MAFMMSRGLPEVTRLIALLLCLSLSGTLAAERRAIRPKDFPHGRSFNPGVLIDGTLYSAGQTGRNWMTGQVPEDFEAEVRQSLNYVGLILKEAGMSFEHVTSVQVVLTDLALFDRMEKVYREYFKEPYPPRTSFGGVTLAGAARIEITVIARK